MKFCPMVSLKTFVSLNFLSCSPFSNSPAVKSTFELCLRNHRWAVRASAATMRMYQMTWLPGPFSPRLLWGPGPEDLESFPEELPLSGVGMSELYAPQVGRSTTCPRIMRLAANLTET